jgi:hypothetical protein
MGDYFEEYDNNHEAMKLLSDLRRTVSDNEGENILGSAIIYLREQAYSFIPYGATTPNKDSYGRYHGKIV